MHHNIPPEIIAIETIAEYASNGRLSYCIVHYERKLHPILSIDGSKSGFVVSLESISFINNCKAIKLA